MGTSHRSLHARFRRAMLGVSAVVLLVASVVVFEVARGRYVRAEQASVHAMVSAVDKSLAVGAYARDQVLLQELLDGLARHPIVRRVEIREPAGRALVAAATRTSTPAAASAPAAEDAPDLVEPLVSPFDAAESLGHLRLWLENDRLLAEAGRQAALLVSVLVVLIVVVLAVFNALAQRLLSRPMHQLAQALAGITPGTNGRVQVEARHDRDEVGIVARAANQLLELQEGALAREREMREAIAALEARYRGILDASSAGIFVLSLDGAVQHANPALWRLLGRTPDDTASLIDRPFAEPAQLRALIEGARASLQPESADLALSHDDGRLAWVHCMLTVIERGAAGEGHIEGVLYDITSRHERERTARHQAEHDALTGLKSRTYIETLLDSQVHDARDHDGAVTLMFVDLDGFKGVNDRWGHAAGDAVLIESAHRLQSIFRRTGDVVGRLGGDELVVVIKDAHANDREVVALAGRLVDLLKEPFALPNGEQATIGASVGLASYPLHATTSETLVRAADAAMYAVKNAGKGGFVVAVVPEGVTAYGPGGPGADGGPASVDALTGLIDRRGLVDRLAQLRGAVAARGACAAVMCLDVDDFKSVNLVCGPQVGDELLCEVAARLRRSLRQEDTVARTGSDEFVVLVPIEVPARPAAQGHAQVVLDRLTRRLSEAVTVGEHRLDIRVSIGVSLLTPQTVDAQQVLQEAQLALRLAKSRRRGEALFFEAAMMAGFLQQRSLEDDLRRAVADDQLRLHVQPQIDRSGRVCGGEALLRWQHPVRGLVPPGDFIPLAESTGLIVELGRWVLRRGCEILAQMHRAGEGRTLAVNISPLQFSQPGFVADVCAALQLAGAPPEALILEITEGLLVTDIAQVGAKIRALTARGIRFSIDDFGTGYSSLAYLRQLPLHEIKIDRSFTAGLPDDQASVGIVRSILSMGRHLGLSVVAEGVETPAQAEFLRTHGCDVQQGWLHGRPCPAEAFLAALAAPPASAATPPAEALR
jgi:diguanylate cyclase (GGDEF)-like protein/PAS domain S-box-containing protein